MTDQDDPLRAFRAIIAGCLIGLALWALLLFGICHPWK